MLLVLPIVALCLSGAASTHSKLSAYRVPDEAQKKRVEALRLVKSDTHVGLDRAARLLEQSTHALRVTGSDKDAATDYLSLGEIYFIRSKYKLALRNYGEAFSLTRDSIPELAASALSHMAVVYATTGGIKKSLELSEQALKISASTNDSHAQAEALEARAEGLLYSNTPKEALPLLDSAVMTFKACNDKRAEARAHLTAAYVQLSVSSFSEAFRESNNALQLWTTFDDRQGIAESNALLGLLLTAVGEPEQAVHKYKTALNTFKAEGDLDHEAITLNSLGFLNNQMGEYEISLASFKAAKNIFARSGDMTGEIAALEGAAKAEWALHQHGAAKQLYSRMLKLATKTDDARFKASALSALADISKLEHDNSHAEALYEQALELDRSAGHINGEIAILIQLGQFYAEISGPERAFNTFQEALEKSTAQITSRARIHYELARIERGANRLESAQKQVENAIEIIESERTKVADFETRAAYFSSVHEYYQLYVDVLMQLDRVHPDLGFAQQAFEAAEKSKVRSLLDMLASAERQMSCSQPASLQTEEASPKQKESSPAAAASDCSIVVSTASSLSEIQSGIRGDDSVLLEFALGDQQSYAWILDGANVHTAVLPGRAEIARLANRFRQLLTARQQIPGEEDYIVRVRQADRQYARTSKELARILLDPVSQFLAGKRVIVVAEGPLRYIPFSALPLNGENRYLFTKYEVTYAPSASTLISLRTAPPRHPPPIDTAAIFADPVFSVDDTRLANHRAEHPERNNSLSLRAVMRDVKPGWTEIPRLAASRKEAAAIRNALSKTALVALDFRANREFFLSADLGRYRYLHLATHGILDTKHPEFSGLILSMVDAKGQRINGYVRLPDIYRMKLAADLVVLSSCESALGKDMNSEGIIGLTRAFLYAGSRRVISSLWKVDDAATAELMKRFYSRIAKGETPSAALRGAQLDLLKIPDWRHPYYWAGFVLQGEYR